MLKTIHVALGIFIALLTQIKLYAEAPNRLPNIVLILADDLGYGDVGCYGATKVKTPNMDKLASQGLRFTDAHCTSGSCTPSRYSLMTGEYAWRQKGTGILAGDSSLIIEPGRPTLPDSLRPLKYQTGAVGKWHLGLGRGKVNWNTDIEPGPLEVGFDYSFIIPATGDRVPCVFIENHRVVALDPNDPLLVDYKIKIGDEPTGKEHPELLKMKLSHGHDDTIVNGISRIGYMAGGKIARWKDDEIADRLTTQAKTFIEQHAAQQPNQPFFLYFATHDIHVPRVPHQRFSGTSQCGVRGDVIQELDWSVGEVMDTLERLKLAGNTLVIFSSDNGPVVDDGYADGSVENLNGHVPAGPFRGGKYSNYEGGTRVPFIVRWPGHVKAGTTSSALISQIDLPASFAALLGTKWSTQTGPDSQNMLPALLGQDAVGRESLVEQGGGPLTLAIRKGNWKYIAKPVGPGKQLPELYDLANDIAETHNVIADQPEKTKELRQLLETIRGK